MGFSARSAQKNLSKQFSPASLVVERHVLVVVREGDVLPVPRPGVAGDGVDAELVDGRHL